MKQLENSISLIARIEDCDAYEHVNNTRYPMFAEEARDQLQITYGLSDDDLVEKDLRFAISDMSVAFRREILPYQRIYINSSLIYKGGVRFEMTHQLAVDDQLCAIVRTDHFFAKLGGDGRLKPIKPPKEYLNLFKE